MEIDLGLWLNWVYSWIGAVILYHYENLFDANLSNIVIHSQ